MAVVPVAVVLVVPVAVVLVVAVERAVTVVPVLAAVSMKAVVQMETSGTEGLNISGSPTAVGVAARAAGRVALGVRNRNDASVESIEGRRQLTGVSKPLG
jgi:hypothetical protein